MANLTLVVNDDLLRRARNKALEQGTTVSAVLLEFLEVYSGAKPQQESAIEDLLEMSRRATSSRGEARWSREDLHERQAD